MYRIKNDITKLLYNGQKGPGGKINSDKEHLLAYQ